MLLSNIYSNRFDKLVDSSDEKIIIWPIRNITDSRAQPAQSKIRVTGNFDHEEEEILKEMIEDGMDISFFT